MFSKESNKRYEDFPCHAMLVTICLAQNLNHAYSRFMHGYNFCFFYRISFLIAKSIILSPYETFVDLHIEHWFRDRKGFTYLVYTYFSFLSLVICVSFLPSSIWRFSTTDCSCEWDCITDSRVAAISLFTALASSLFFCKDFTYKGKMKPFRFWIGIVYLFYFPSKQPFHFLWA